MIARYIFTVISNHTLVNAHAVICGVVARGFLNCCCDSQEYLHRLFFLPSIFSLVIEQAVMEVIAAVANLTIQLYNNFSIESRNTTF